MKILIINLGIGGGGAERVLVDIIKYWRDNAEIAAKITTARNVTGGGIIESSADSSNLAHLAESNKADSINLAESTPNYAESERFSKIDSSNPANFAKSNAESSLDSTHLAESNKADSNANSTLINPKRDIDLFLIEKKAKDAYLGFVEEHLHKVFSFPHIFGKVRFLNKFFKRRVLNHPNLINYIIKERYDVNIGFLEGISSIYVSQKNGGRKIGYIHTSLFEMREGRRDSAELEAYRRLDCIICVSKYVKDSLLRLYPELQNKDIRVIHNPINTKNILIKSNLALELKRAKFTFLQIGRLTYQKGLITLLEANKILLDSLKESGENAEYEIWLLGEGERYKKELDELLKSQGVDNVRFLGFSENPYNIIKLCDCVVLASYFEGCPLVLAESCVLNKAIISSDIPTSKELLDNGGVGCASFFESKNARELAECMRRVLSDEAYKKELESLAGNLGRKYDISKTIEQIQRAIMGK